MFAYSQPPNQAQLNPSNPTTNQSPVSLCFERGEMVNAYVLSVAELLRDILGDDYWYSFDFPLQMLCNKREHIFLPKELWQFWVNSRVDIAIMNSQVGKNCRQASLLVECQSPFHDRPEVELNDRTKAKVIAASRIPLIYVQYVDYPRVLKFWNLGKEETFYNPFNQKGRSELVAFLQEQFF